MMLRECGAAGHCAYHCASLWAFGDTQRHILLRNLVADVLASDDLLRKCVFAFSDDGVVRMKLEEIKLEILRSNDRSFSDTKVGPQVWNRHVMNVRCTNLYATTCEIRILAVLLCCDVIIFTPKKDHVRFALPVAISLMV
jgi:hypothetical protein